MKNPIQTLFFLGTSELTKYFPRLGSRVLNLFIRTVVGNRFLLALFSLGNRLKLRRVRAYRRILVNPDIHIGDAIMAQAVVSALRDFFPEAEIDFVTNRSVFTVLDGNPEVRRFFPIYSGGDFPPDSELEAVKELMRTGSYDLCINSNPFLDGNRLAKNFQPVIDVTSNAPNLIRNESTVSEINHFSFQHQRFIHGLMNRITSPKKNDPFVGVTVRLSDKALEEAAKFVTGLNSEKALVLVNTDTASPYTRVPFKYQVDLVQFLLEKDISILIGAGHSEAGLGARLIAAFPEPQRSRLHLIPAKMSLEAYSALGDHCDLFITGDTGPMHIAAARKVSLSGKHVLRNRTALLCLFGATPARMSGYDSFQPGYLPANQDAPSWTVVADSPCRNITCINKLFKTCQTIRCFESLDMEIVQKKMSEHLGV